MIKYVGNYLTPEDRVRYAPVITALRGVPHGDRVRVYASAADDAETHLNEAGYRRSSGHPCIWRLLGQSCTPATQMDRPCAPPATDHASLWLREGQPAFFLSEPYALHITVLVEIVAFAQKHGLDVAITAAMSPHFPGATVGVKYTRKGD